MVLSQSLQYREVKNNYVCIVVFLHIRFTRPCSGALKYYLEPKINRARVGASFLYQEQMGGACSLWILLGMSEICVHCYAHYLFLFVLF